MDIQTLIMPIVVIAFGLFAGATYVYRKMTVGEAFKWEKFLPTMGIGGIAAIVLYLASGALPSIESILTQIELMAPGGVPSVTVILAALLAIYNSLVKSVAATPVSTPAKQAATVEQAKSGLAPSPAFPAGKAAVLGIYGGSASGAPSAQSFVCDVNQVPTMFFDTLTLVTGKVMAQISIDGALLKDWEENGMSLKVIGEKLPHDFWIPQKYRTPGEHTLEIRMGFLEGAENITPGGSDSFVVWEEVAPTFTLTFTGIKANE